MKKSFFLLAAVACLALCGVAAQAMGLPINMADHAATIGVAGMGMGGMINFVQNGDVLDLDPGATVPAGTGCLFGAALFGVAAVDGVAGVKSAFVVEGVVTIAKTSALAIAVGDRLFWDATNKVVNKTTTAQQQVGIAVEAAANPSSTVKMLIESALPAAT